jgi:DNA-binding HxlR family transcriptional regulator
MSAVPQRTQILIKDLPFQEKYHLSHTQTDLMAYLVNVISWAICIDGYYVILTNKILSDLPTIGIKTLEASLKALKDLGLIECKMVEVPQWKGKFKYRGMKLTSKGKEYNAKLILPTQDKKMRDLEKKNRELEEENKKLQEIINNMSVSESEVSTPNQEEPKPIVPEMPTKQPIEIFIDDVVKRFGRSSQPICNAVPTWNKETTFYINIYNRLSVITPANEHKQLKDPLLIYSFWQWLYANSRRIGDKIDFNKKPTIKELEKRFLNQTVLINDRKERVHEFVEVADGVKIKVANQEGKIRFIMDKDTHKEKVFELGMCQKILFDRLH